MIKLLPGRIAVAPIDDSDETPSRNVLSEQEKAYLRSIGSEVKDRAPALIIPEQAKERCDQGIVKYIAKEGVYELKPLDYVIFSGYTGTLVYIEGEGRMIIMPEEFVQAKIVNVPSLEIPGLYFRSSEGFIPANYEQCVEMIANAFVNDDWQGRLKVNVPRPTYKDYDGLRAGSGTRRSND